MAVIHRADPQFFRLALIMLTVALAIATALAIYFAATRTSTVSDDSGSPAPPSVGQQGEPCWATNVPC